MLEVCLGIIVILFIVAYYMQDKFHPYPHYPYNSYVPRENACLLYKQCGCNLPKDCNCGANCKCGPNCGCGANCSCRRNKWM